MKGYAKPLPKPTPWSRPFWVACKERKLLVQKCEDCQKYIFYPKLFCPFCLSERLHWVESSGKGKIYSFTVVYSYQPTEFEDDVPYVIAVIELEEGVRMMSNIVECKPDDIRCDMEVEVIFEQVTDDVTFPRFRPVN